MSHTEKQDVTYYSGHSIEVNGKRYVSERTCHPVLMDAAGRPPYRKGNLVLDALSDGCSECGCPWRRGAGNLPSYCPNCGAKVMI